jgi:adenylate cyclase
VNTDSDDTLNFDTDGRFVVRAARVFSWKHGRPLAVVLLVLLVLIQVWSSESVWRPVRNMVFDAMQRVYPRQIDRLPVVIVDIDEASLKDLGQWPWPRTRIATLIQAAIESGALAVGLDFIMPEPDRMSPNEFVKERPDLDANLRATLADLPSNDAILAEVLKHTPTVIGHAGVDNKTSDDQVPSHSTPVMMKPEVSLARVKSFAGVLANVPVIEDAAVGRGYINATRDEDGVVRVMPLVFTINGKPAPSMAVELLRVATGQDWYTLHGGPHGLTGISLGDFFIPVDPDGRRRVYFSLEDSRRRVSALDLLKGRLDPKAMANQVAIIGVSALGLVDTAPTPVAPLMDGTEIHAQVIENIVLGTRLVRPGLTEWLEPAATLAVALILILLNPYVRAPTMVGIYFAALIGFVTAGLIGFTRYQVLLDPSFPVVAGTLILFILLASRYAAVDLKRRELKAALESEKIRSIRLAGELDAARSIQMGILPDPKAIQGLPPNVRVHAFLEPAGMVGGDFYDALMIDPRHFFFLIGDVSGKGIPASLFMALSKTLTKSVALRGNTPLDELILSANDEISRENPADLFVTAVACILDADTGNLDFCIAGHDSPVLLRQGQAPSLLKSDGGPPLCILDDFPYPVSSVQLQAGDMVVLITDGITEAHNPDSDLYGKDRAMAYLTGMHAGGEGDLSPEQVCQGLYEDVKIFAHGADAFDDITIMAVRFDGAEKS